MPPVSRCGDPTEFGTNFSTIKREGVYLSQKKPLEPACPWTGSGANEAVSVPASEVYEAMTEIGQELAILQMSKYFLRFKKVGTQYHNLQ